MAGRGGTAAGKLWTNTEKRRSSIPDYKELYFSLFRATEAANRILIDAQRAAEEQYLAGDCPPLTLTGKTAAVPPAAAGTKSRGKRRRGPVQRVSSGRPGALSAAPTANQRASSVRMARSSAAVSALAVSKHSSFSR